MLKSHGKEAGETVLIHLSVRHSEKVRRYRSLCETDRRAVGAWPICVGESDVVEETPWPGPMHKRGHES